ncbi:MAG: hypothetical protein ABJA80_05230 [bacterium]
MLSRIALALLYFIVVTPIGVVRRLLGGNPMIHRTGDMGYWQRRSPASNEADAMRGPS